MRWSLFPYDSWQYFNNQLKQKLNIPHDVVIFRGMEQALFEIGWSLARQFPFKKRVDFLTGTNFILDRTMISFSKESYDIKIHKLGQDSQISDDTLFFVDSSDDPFTGEIFPPRWNYPSGKKIYHILLSHNSYSRDENPYQVHPYQIKILGLSSELSIAILGERVQLGVIPSSTTFWKTSEIEKIENLIKQSFNWDQNTIQDFENSQYGGFTPLLSSQSKRCWDRAVVYWKDMDGEAFIRQLSMDLGFNLNPQGEENRLEATSFCRWSKLDWLAQKHSPDVIRGLVVFSVNLLKPNFGKSVEKARNKILNLQCGENHTHAPS